MTSEQRELLPCPFCGCKTVYLTDGLSEDGYFTVWCEDGCSATSSFCADPDEAVTAWNTRPSSPGEAWIDVKNVPTERDTPDFSPPYDITMRHYSGKLHMVTIGQYCYSRNEWGWFSDAESIMNADDGWTTFGEWEAIAYRPRPKPCIPPPSESGDKGGEG